ncbi:MAG: RNA-binding S4 domain-containing protein [Bacteroidetes bacterium]|nr:RNA-binding S4 domain-containing protein [Bacteroidota bacterium]
METFKIKGEYIQLNQLLKILGWCGSGSEANMIIESGDVMVNGVVELRKRNKIVPGTKVRFLDKEAEIL